MMKKASRMRINNHHRYQHTGHWLYTLRSSYSLTWIKTILEHLISSFARNIFFITCYTSKNKKFGILHTISSAHSFICSHGSHPSIPFQHHCIMGISLGSQENKHTWLGQAQQDRMVIEFAPGLANIHTRTRMNGTDATHQWGDKFRRWRWTHSKNTTTAATAVDAYDDGVSAAIAIASGMTTEANILKMLYGPKNCVGRS